MNTALARTAPPRIDLATKIRFDSEEELWHRLGAMDVTILRTGASRQYSENWAKAFGQKKGKASPVKKAAGKKRTARGKAAKK